MYKLLHIPTGEFLRVVDLHYSIELRFGSKISALYAIKHMYFAINCFGNRALYHGSAVIYPLISNKNEIEPIEVTKRR